MKTGPDFQNLKFNFFVMDMHVQIAAEIFRYLSPGPHKFGGYGATPSNPPLDVAY